LASATKYDRRPPAFACSGLLAVTRGLELGEDVLELIIDDRAAIDVDAG
jgi:hypothetical protein